MGKENANHTPNTAPHASGKRCAGVTKKGGHCPWKPEGEGAFCWRHDPALTEERTQRLSELGARGKARQVENKAALFKEIKLSTTKDIQAAITESLNDVRKSSADVIAKANATARLSSVALEIIKTRDIERELDELRDLVERKLKSPMNEVEKACKKAGFDPVWFLLALANGDNKAIGEKDPIPKKEQRKAAKFIARYFYRAYRR